MQLQNTHFWAVLDRASSFALINLLWVIFSLPLVTLPAATAGLFAVHTDWARGKESEGLGRFFSAMYHTAWKATLIGLGTAAGLMLVSLNLLILPQMDLPTGVLVFSAGITLVVGWAILTTNLYIWILLAITNLAIRDLIQLAAKLAFQHAVWSSSLLLVSASLLLIGLWALPSGGVVLVLFSSIAWAISWGAWKVIQPIQMELISDD